MNYLVVLYEARHDVRSPEHKVLFGYLVQFFSKYLAGPQPCSPSYEPPLKGFHLTRNFGDRAKHPRSSYNVKQVFVSLSEDNPV